MHSLRCIDGLQAETMLVSDIHCVGDGYTNPLRFVEIGDHATVAAISVLLRGSDGGEVIIRTTAKQAQYIQKCGNELVLEPTEKIKNPSEGDLESR